MKDSITKKIISILIVLMMVLSYVPPFISHAEANESNITVGPVLVTTKYETNDTVVADFVINPAEDTSTDMYATIQTALNDCSNNGGGTVWLSEGVYHISRNITIPKSCTLRGDYQEPSKYTGTLKYGTIIVADVNNIQYDTTDNERTGLFKLSSSSGIVGITVYYKNQSITNPVEQPWTFYYGNKTLMTIKNVTFINSYRGIGRSTADGGVDESDQVHEMLMLENVKGTALKTGVLIHNSSDVGTVTGLSLTPYYWSSANLNAIGESGTNPSYDAIASKIKSIDGKGLVLTDVEQQQYTNVTIAGYKYGIYIPKDDRVQVKRRAMGSGLMYNFNISNCKYGIMVEDGYELDWRCGYYITNSYIEGGEYAIYNNSAVEPTGTGKRGTLQLNDVTLKGKIGGAAPVIYYSDEDGKYISANDKVGNGDATGIINNTGKFSNINLDRPTKSYGTNFVVIEAGWSASIINFALKQVGDNGGGVVYLKPGLYNINETIIVPENTELRGASGVSTRIAGAGEKCDAAGSVRGESVVGTVINVKTTNASAVELNGDNAGISGIVFVYEDNLRDIQESNHYTENQCTITSHNKKGVYIRNVAIMGASHGIGLDNCEYYTISNYVTGVFKLGILIVGGNNGLIVNCLQNSTVASLNGLYDFNGGYFSNLLTVTHAELEYIYLQGAENVEILNTFAYGTNKFLVSIGSKSYIVNSGLDGMPNWLEYNSGINTTEKPTRYMFYFDGASRSDSMIVNTLRINGTYGKSQVNGDYGTNNVGIYNRGSLGIMEQWPNDPSPEYKGQRENDLRSNIFRSDNWTSKQYNSTNIKVNSDFSNSTNMVNVTNKKGVPYYSVGTKINESNYNSVGTTSIPTIEGKEAGTYTIYYYIPETNLYYEKEGVLDVTITNIDSEPPVANVTYSTQELTNESVTVTITANEELQNVEGWKISNNKKILTKTYTSNATETVKIKDLAGNETIKNISITNISKDAPIASVNYSIQDATNGNVDVVILANKVLQEVDGWTKSNDGKSLIKTYTSNKTETVTIKDLAGNETTVEIAVTNIDKTIPVATASYSTKNATNENVIVTITANEVVQDVEGWTKSSNGRKLTKTYTKNGAENVEIKDLAGNKVNVSVAVNNIDKEGATAEVSYSTKNATNGNVIVTITANEALQDVNGWDKSSNGKVLTKTYTSNTSVNVIIKDLAGNTSSVTVTITNIDKTAPTANVSYSTTGITNENVTITITANEELQDVNGWTKSNNGKVLTKTYTSNTSENVTIRDLVGNETEIILGINNIDKIAPIASVSYSITAETNQNVTATITANEALQDVNGWTKSIDGKILTKTYTSNTNENVIIKDIAGNEEEVVITISNISKQAKGDLNGNNKIDVGDILLLQRHIAQSNSADIANKHSNWRLNDELINMGDVNKNNKIDVGDILLIQRYIAATNNSEIASVHQNWLEI